MRILIVEDEITSARNLSGLLKDLDPDYQLLAILESVEETINWLDNNSAPDLAFFDIRLADGSSLEILNQRNLSFPVIFCTAYDQYILEALEHNAIDYLLKPYSEQRLHKSLEKISLLEKHFQQKSLQKVLKTIETPGKQYREFLLVKSGLEHLSIPVNEIAYCFTEYKLVFIKHRNDKNYLIDQTLSQICDQLDPGEFFRANRQFIIHRTSVLKYKIGYKSKIYLTLKPPPGQIVVVSQEKSRSFKNWIGGNQ